MGDRDVLVIIDMLTDWDFDGADEVAAGAVEKVEAINRARRLRSEGLRVVFANDLDCGFHGSRERSFSLAVGSASGTGRAARATP